MSELSKRLGQLSPVKRKLLEERMRKGSEVAEPIALVGMGCRFAGAPSIEAFWRVIRDGVDAIGEIPPSRWDVDEFYDPSGETPGKMSTRWGAFVDQVDQFDPLFFGISPREAERVDPQHRLLLEVAWEALEYGNIAPERLAGSNTGVFIGIGGVDYSRIPAQLEDHYEQITVHGGTGNALSIAANRLSYVLDLHGPSLIVDTACSSSLVALHLAVRSLRARECNAALAGGVNLILTPEVTLAFSKAHMLSPDGHCRPFDAAANGYVRGEGCGIVVLKRLTDAVAEGDRILAVIRATAVNQDGRTSGITAPNPRRQQAVIERALAEAGLTSQRVRYLEAHGTGTPLGDPMEFEALSKVFAASGQDEPPCYITSVKGNIGHTETAAGIASLIKVALLFEHDSIPPQVHFRQLNPNIRLEGSRLCIPTEGVRWPAGEGRIAGISSFGFGGTNAHVVLEEPAPLAESASPQRPLALMALSAKTKTALEQLAGRYAAYLADHPEAVLADVCFSANTGRSHFHHRLAITADSTAALGERLAAAAAGKTADGVRQHQVKIVARPKAVFLFTGQGSQYSRMGRRLFEAEPVFRQSLEECQEILRSEIDVPLLDVMYGDEQAKLIDETAYTQPALFALEYSLARLWRSWGIEPAAVLGHSVGEYAAACFAGVFSLEDGLKLIAARARLMQSLPHDGLMAAVFCGPEQLSDDLAACGGSVTMAALNGPSNTVISGAAEGVRRVLARLEEKGVQAQLLTVSHAFHSPLMDPILDRFEEQAKKVMYGRPQVPLAANLLGRLIGDASIDARYWREHLRRPVQFAEGMRRLAELEPEIYLEIGPAATLLGMGSRCVPKGNAAWMPSLRKGQDDLGVLYAALGEMYVRGFKVDWRGFDRPWPRRHVALPTYPFERTRLWFDLSKRRKPGDTVTSRGPRLHPLLGARVPTALTTEVYENRLGRLSPRYLADHQVQGSAVTPAAAYVEQALAAAEQAFGGGAHALEQLSIQQAMTLADSGRQVQLALSPEVNGQREFEIYSVPAEASAPCGWTLHATGWVRPQPIGAGDEEPLDLAALRARMTETSSREAFYEHMQGRGLHYGPTFQVLDQLRRGAAEAMAEIRIHADLEKEVSQYRLHPVLGDACFQSMAGIVPLETGGGYSPAMYLPVGVRSVRVLARPSGPMFTYAVRTSTDERPSPEVVEGDVWLLDEQGRKLAELRGVRIQRLGRGTRSAEGNWAELLYQVAWQPLAADVPVAAVSSPDPWLILADRSGIGAALARQLAGKGQQSIVVYAEGAAGGERQIDPLSESAYERLFSGLQQDGRPRCAGVVHLWACELADAPDGPADLADARGLGPRGALQLMRRMARTAWKKSPSLWLVTRGGQAVNASESLSPSQASLWGMGRVAAMELPDFRTTLVDLDPASSIDESAHALATAFELADGENQFAYRDGKRWAPRLVKAAELMPADSGQEFRIPPSGPFRLRLTQAGSFDSLRYESFERRPPGPGQVEVEVQAAGLNFSDVLKAMGLYPGITDDVVPLGIESAGVVAAVGEGVERFRPGDAVMGVAPYSFASHATTADYALVHRPQGLSPDEACTVPITFLTAYFGLVKLAQLQRGEKVLIHAAAGGVGLAAIQIARQIGAEVFATAGSREKQEYLRSLGIEHIYSSRTLEFADEIMEATGRRGVDVVLNSLPGEAIAKSLSILSAYGRFLEIGKTDIYQNRKIGLLPFQDNLAYFAIDLDRVLRQRPAVIRQLFAEVMEHFERGAYRPLPMAQFPAEKSVDAFRYMAQRKNIGKVVLSLQRQASGEHAESASAIRGDATYLVTGGLGAIGLGLAQWLAAHGARRLALVGRGRPGDAAMATMAAMRAEGVEVVVIQADVAQGESLRAAIESQRDPERPLRGVFHAAGVLDDGLIHDLSLDRLDKVMAPKVQGGWNLHLATLDEPIEIFALFSSISALLGSPGQANYAAGNAYLDGLAAYRRSRGLPAVSINWGPWAGSGMAADAKLEQQMAARGLTPLDRSAAFGVLGALLRTQVAEVAVVDANWDAMARSLAGRRAPLLETLAAGSAAGDKPAEDNRDHALRSRIREASSDQRRQMLAEYLAAELARIMSIGASTLDLDEPLSALGMDSLMGMELKNNIESRLGVQLPMAALVGGPSLRSLAIKAAESFELGEGGSSAEAGEALPAATDWSLIVPLARGGSERPLFCVHPVGGDVRCYFDISTHVGKERPVYALRARGIEPGTAPHTSVEEMAADYLAAMKQLQPEGPYDLCGWSTGGIYAYEMARQLHAAGVPAGKLLFFDTPLPEIFARTDLSDDARFLFDVVNFSNWFANAQMAVSYDELRAQGAEAALAGVLQEAQAHGVLPPAATTSHLRQLIEVCRAHVRATLAYQPQPFPQPIYFFRPKDRQALAEAAGQELTEHHGWDELAGDMLRIQEVPGHHFTMMTAENAALLAEALLAALREP